MIAAAANAAKNPIAIDKHLRAGTARVIGFGLIPPRRLPKAGEAAQPNGRRNVPPASIAVRRIAGRRKFDVIVGQDLVLHEVPFKLAAFAKPIGRRRWACTVCAFSQSP